MTAYVSRNGEAALAALAAAAEGFDLLSLGEACAILLAQVIASDADDLPSAQKRARALGRAMAMDIAANWPFVVDQRRKEAS
jgi:hypothetical protein